MRDNKWGRLLAYITGLVNQRLLLQCEYLVAENRVLRSHLNGRQRLSDNERSTLAEIAKRLGRKHLVESAEGRNRASKGDTSPHVHRVWRNVGLSSGAGSGPLTRDIWTPCENGSLSGFEAPSTILIGIRRSVKRKALGVRLLVSGVSSPTRRKVLPHRQKSMTLPLSPPSSLPTTLNGSSPKLCADCANYSVHNARCQLRQRARLDNQPITKGSQ